MIDTVRLLELALILTVAGVLLDSELLLVAAIIVVGLGIARSARP